MEKEITPTKIEIFFQVSGSGPRNIEVTDDQQGTGTHSYPDEPTVDQWNACLAKLKAKIAGKKITFWINDVGGGKGPLISDP